MEKTMKKKVIPDTRPINTVSNCNFNQEVKVWDEKAINAVNDVAKALLNMTELFKSQKVAVNMGPGILLSGEGVSTFVGQSTFNQKKD